MKDAKQELLKPLTHVINTYLYIRYLLKSTGSVQNHPNLQEKNTWEMSNYRSTALQNGLGKIFEKCILCQLVQYFEKIKLFDMIKHSFRECLSRVLLA